ncbi:TolC family protein [Flammeovirgaceae bacterium SG7u.111]|nr:TolC family protein [Flammeovirgaceae bacterium SG7u.132]WPO37261.1 TolC family protein [Flammeovirgaceae bacterium SG7u.111]
MMEKIWMVIRSTSLLAFFISATILEAQSQSMSLKECIEYGLENHRSNKIYTNDLHAAEAKIQQGKSAYLPQVSINGEIDDNLKVQTSVIPGSIVGSDQDMRVAFTKQFSTNITAQVEQTIFDQSLITSFKAYRYTRQEAELNKELNDESIIYNVVTAYYHVLVSREQLAFLSENIEIYKKQMAIADLRVAKGVMTEVDQNRIKVNYHNTLSQLNVAENTLTFSENQLKNYMGFPLADQIQIDSIALSEKIFDLAAQHDKTAFNSEVRTDFKLSQVNVSLLEIDEKRLRAQALPQLKAFGRYGGVGFGDNLSESFSTIADFATVGVKLNIPIFTGFNRVSQVKQAQFSLQNAKENLELQKENFALEYENSHNKLVQSRANLDNDDRTLELSRSVFQSTDLQYEKGVVGLTDWLDTQRSLRDSQSSYLTSLFSFYESLVELEKANGTLKNFYNSLQ